MNNCVELSKTSFFVCYVSSVFGVIDFTSYKPKFTKTSYWLRTGNSGLLFRMKSYLEMKILYFLQLMN